MAAPPAIDVELLGRYGLEGALKTIGLNPGMFPAVKATLEASGLAHADSKTGNLLFNLTSGLTDPRIARRDFVARYVGEGKLVNGAQLTAAMDFFKKRAPDAEFSVAEFETACGAGVTFTDEQLGAKVGVLACLCALRGTKPMMPWQADEVIAAARADIEEQRFLFLPATLLSKFSEGTWKWADRVRTALTAADKPTGLAIPRRVPRALQGKAKALIDERFAALVGPRTPEDDVREAAAKEAKKKGGAAKGGKAAAAPAAASAASAAPAAGGAATAAVAAAPAAASSGAPESAAVSRDAFEGRDLASAHNTPALLAAHAAATGGKVGGWSPPLPAFLRGTRLLS